VGSCHVSTFANQFFAGQQWMSSKETDEFIDECDSCPGGGNEVTSAMIQKSVTVWNFTMGGK
jgi:hypothetical protein